MVSDFLLRNSFDICMGAALVIGFGIGVLISYQYGSESGHADGYSDGFDMGYAIGKREKAKRDEKGRFTR